MVIILGILVSIVPAVLICEAEHWLRAHGRGIRSQMLAPFRAWAGLDETRRPKPQRQYKYLQPSQCANPPMIFLFFFAVLLYIVLPICVLLGAFALLIKLLQAMQRRGVGRWLFAPFRAWTGMDETRKPRLQPSHSNHSPREPLTSMLQLLIFPAVSIFVVSLLIALAIGVVQLVCGAIAWLGAHGVGHWLLAPFRSWTGMDETRRPKP